MSAASEDFDLAVILRAPGVGGVERHTADLLNYLVKAGQRVVFFQGGGDLRTLGLREAPGKLDIVPTALPLRDLSREDLRGWDRLLRSHPARRTLVVKTWYPEVDLELVKLLRRLAPGLFQFEHSLPPPLGPHPGGRYFGIVPRPGLWWYRERWRRRRMGRLVDRVFVDSEEARRQLLEHAFLDEDRVVAFTNGVDPQRWAPDAAKARVFRERYGIPADHYLFGVAGRVAPLKGIDLALRGFERLLRGRDGASLCVVGDGPARGELEQLARELGLDGRVRFTGYVDDIGEAYSAIDTILLPSLLESCPLSLLEGMACGCRVIASPVGGVPELLGDPTCSDLVAERDADAWAAVMKRHADAAPGERAALAERARAYVAEAHSQDRQFRFIADTLAAGPRAHAGGTGRRTNDQATRI